MAVFSIITRSYASESGGVGYEHVSHLVVSSTVFVALLGQLSSPPWSHRDQVIENKMTACEWFPVFYTHNGLVLLVLAFS